MMKYVFLIVTLFFVRFSFSQSETLKPQKLIQLSGVIVSSDSLKPIPYSTVYNKTVKRGTLSDSYGYFSTVVLPGDTLIFNRFGFYKSSYIVPDTLRDDRYSIIHVLQVDSINPILITIYPWPSKEDFARAFVEMQPYDDALRRAQKMLSGSNLAYLASTIEADASSTYSWQRNQQYTKLYSIGQGPVNNLFNPVAWSQFVDAWKSGKLKRE
jgi:hypothetical protein